MSEVSRRDFLRGAAAAAGIALLATGARPAPAAAVTARGPLPHALADLPAAVVARGTNDDSAATILKAALDGLGGIGRFVRPGQTVVIKPNATWAYPPGTASSTDPGMLAALITVVREAGAARVIVVDRSTLWPVTAALQQSGIGKVLDDLGVEKVIPDGPVAPAKLCTGIELPQGKAFKKLYVLTAAVEADVRINLAVAKSHKVTKYTLCLKHMMGFLQTPGQIHTRLEQGIADLSTPSPLAAHLHILEAIRVRLAGQAGGRQTELTAPKVVARPNEIVAGVDPVLIDAYGLETYFGRKPKELAHVYLAGQAGTGESDVRAAREAGLIRVVVTTQAASQATTAPQAAEPMTERAATSTATPERKATASGEASPAATGTEPTGQGAPPRITARPAADKPSSAATGPSTAASPASPPAATSTIAPSATLAASPTAVTPTLTPSATITPPPPPTTTPLPTALAAAVDLSGGAPAACPAVTAVNPGPFMNLALAPVAMVVAGAGIVLRGRMAHRPPPQGGAVSEHAPGAPAESEDSAGIEYRAEPEDGHAAGSDPT